MNYAQRTAAALTWVMLLTLPLALSAEDTAPPTIVSAASTSTVGIPSAKINGQGGAHPVLLRRTMSSSTNKDGQETGMRGGKIMASDTRELPRGVTGLIQERDKEGGRSGTSTGEGAVKRGRMLGTTTRDCPTSGSSSECTPRGALMRDRIGEHRGEIFKHSGEILLRRMDAAVDRFTKIAARIDSRIKKMKVAGTDTTNAEAALLTALIKIGDAKKAIEEARVTIDVVASNLSSGTSTLPTESEKKPAKDALEKARQAIITAMQALNDVMPLLTSSRSANADREHASSTIASSTPKFPGMMRTNDRLIPAATSMPNGTQ